MNKLLNKIKKRVIDNSGFACFFKEKIRVISEIEMLFILEEEFAKYVSGTNAGNGDWIPETKKVPGHTNNVTVTARNHKGELEVAVGWYEDWNDRWRVCFNDDYEFKCAEVIAWKESSDEPYQPGRCVPE